MRFSVALDLSDRLEFPTFHDMVDLPVILQACGPPLQYARVIPKDGQDIENFEVFQTYMTKHRKVGCDVMPLHIITFQSLCVRLF